MNKIFDTIVWGFLLLFAVPSVMIVASWNSLPGDQLYGMKLSMEQALLVLASPSYSAKGSLQVKYTERRFSEAKRLLADKASVEGLVYLGNQVDTTKTVIVQAPNAKTQKELAHAYIATLNTVATQLEQQRHVAAASPASPPQVAPRTSSVGITQNSPRVAAPTVPAARNTPGTRPTQATVSRPAQPTLTATSASAATQAEVVAEIAHTEEKIQETIKEMEKVEKEAEQQEHREEQEEKREEKKDEQGNEGKEPEENNGRGNDGKDD